MDNQTLITESLTKTEPKKVRERLNNAHRTSKEQIFSEDDLLHELKRYLPSQAPLKDFIHHNTLHAFQQMHFHDALRNASQIFGYKTSLSIDEYRELFIKKKIRKDTLVRLISQRYGPESVAEWMETLTLKTFETTIHPKIGRLHQHWRSVYHVDLDTIVHTNLFRILNCYLDQGIAISGFPVTGAGFLPSLRELDHQSMVSFFKTKKAGVLFHDQNTTITRLLQVLVGDQRYFRQYLFDQQFAHPGWSGLVSVIEDKPGSLFDGRKITLRELIFLELILEIDNLENTLRGKWEPLATQVKSVPIDLFAENPTTELDEAHQLFQEAFEWTYYDEVLAGIKEQLANAGAPAKKGAPDFQAFFCIDDRECSIRRHIEHFDPKSETYGTPGHFGVDAYFQPKNAKFYTQICPAPVTPKHLITEVTTKRESNTEIHFTRHAHGLLNGWLISQTLGFWSAIKLVFNVFRPGFSPSSTSSFTHMEEFSTLVVENRSSAHQKDGLQIGYTISEMADRVESVLKSTGLVNGFAPIVYIIGHGASSANNTHYAGYDCGACSGRPGSANARAFSYMANHREVRRKLEERGIIIPGETEFLGGLHDTTRDEFTFYDEELLSPDHLKLHQQNQQVFAEALQANAKERSRRFLSINTKDSAPKVHKKVKTRSVSLFEPRPELNHATNSLCIIGRRHLNRHLFLDRRAFLNSYDYRIDSDGQFLAGIVSAAAPVCGGINLEYFFSRVDNEKLGAGSKLPHNVMGLIGVANGFEGDLRTGLPRQMIEVHDPVRLMMVIEHFPEVVLKTIRRNPATWEWFINEWVVLTVIHPENGEIYRFENGQFTVYCPLQEQVPVAAGLMALIESGEDNLPVLQLN